MIFGNQKPKFICEGVTYLLDHSTLNPKWLDRQSKEQVSVLTGHREWYEIGDYAEFTVTIFLFKYLNPTAKFEELYPCRNKDVIFYPHRDGEPLLDSVGGTPVLFHITSMEPSYLRNLINYDLLTITFKSKDLVVFPVQ